MEIVETSIEDLSSVIALVTRVAQLDILPHLSEEGNETFFSKVLPDIENTFSEVNYRRLKVMDKDKIIGFGAIRDGQYITHLFIDKASQGLGLGKLLLSRLVFFSTSNNLSLRASINAVSFYEDQGFTCTGLETEIYGIRFVPMSRIST